MSLEKHFKFPLEIAGEKKLLLARKSILREVRPTQPNHQLFTVLYQAWVAGCLNSSVPEAVLSASRAGGQQCNDSGLHVNLTYGRDLCATPQLVRLGVQTFKWTKDKKIAKRPNEKRFRKRFHHIYICVKYGFYTNHRKTWHELAVWPCVCRLVNWFRGYEDCCQFKRHRSL